MKVPNPNLLGHQGIPFLFSFFSQWMASTNQPVGYPCCNMRVLATLLFFSFDIHTIIAAAAAAAAKSLQLCPILCDPIDGSPPDSPFPGILQARTLEWVAISFSNAWKWKVKVKLLSRVQLLATPWTAAYQAPLSMGFSRQEFWNGVPLPSPHTIIKSYQF